jgi:hypothetical protein
VQLGSGSGKQFGCTSKNFGSENGGTDMQPGAGPMNVGFWNGGGEEMQFG